MRLLNIYFTHHVLNCFTLYVLHLNCFTNKLLENIVSKKDFFKNDAIDVQLFVL